MTNRWLLPVLLGIIIGVISWQATLLATPYVLMSKAMDRIGSRAPLNSFGFGELATAANQPIVRPSPDLLYATCVFDVSDGPVRIEVPPVPGTYWSVSIFDARTDVAKVVSMRDIGDEPARLLLFARDNQPDKAKGYDPVALDHDTGIALIRILLDDPARFAEIDAIRRKSTCKRG